MLITFLTMHNLDCLELCNFLLVIVVCFTQDKSKSYLDQENIKLLAIPSISQANKQTPEEFSAQNLIAGHEEEDRFTTQQLFSFAWQIARGMVRFITSSMQYISEDICLTDIYTVKLVTLFKRNWLDFGASYFRHTSIEIATSGLSV